MTTIALVFSILALMISAVALASSPKDKDRAALKAAEFERDELEKILVDILDADGNVRGQLRLPGKAPPTPKKPNRTPCGDLCSHAWWDKKDNRFRCSAGQGRITDHARGQFLDDEGQCVMYRMRHHL
jgi:hypothetical protein